MSVEEYAHNDFICEINDIMPSQCLIAINHCDTVLSVFFPRIDM